MKIIAAFALVGVVVLLAPSWKQRPQAALAGAVVGTCLFFARRSKQ